MKWILQFCQFPESPDFISLCQVSKMNLIVEALDETHRRLPIFASDRVTSLSDIAMYTVAEDVPLMNILDSVLRKEDGKVCSLDYKKCGKDELHAYFAEILPDYDRDQSTRQRHQEASPVV